MQILANESSFGEAHDDYLIGLNPFLEKNRKEVRDFVNNLIIDIPNSSYFIKSMSCFLNKLFFLISIKCLICSFCIMSS